jgi:hypothetical protein
MVTGVLGDRGDHLVGQLDQAIGIDSHHVGVDPSLEIGATGGRILLSRSD